jgi:hypothetical protein
MSVQWRVTARFDRESKSTTLEENITTGFAESITLLSSAHCAHMHVWRVCIPT